MIDKFWFRIFFSVGVVFLLYGSTAYAQTYSAYVNAGEKSFQNGDYYSATVYFKQALEFENAETDVTYITAEAERLFNDYYSAAFYYNQTIREDKDDKFPLALFWLATMNKMMGEYETAKNLFYQYYNLHVADTNYYSMRAQRELNDCNMAVQLMRDSVPADVKNLGDIVNTSYSDFAGQYIRDSILYYSSLRFENKDPKTKKTKNYISKILTAQNKGSSFRQPQLLDSIFNIPDLHDCNAAFSSDNKLMVFTRCDAINFSNIRCDLYESININGKWQHPVKLNDSINLKNYTSTQPSIANNGADGYILYFVSDRPGGYGKLDLWRSFISTNGIYSSPENLGKEINTVDDEITPYFHNSTQTLYFSSSGHPGMGGYDIFKSKLINNQFSPPENIGYPLNTSYEDLYFTLNENDNKGLLSSNRPGSLYIKSKTCCYDIYAFNFVKKDTALVLVDSTAIVKVETKSSSPIVIAKQLLPLELYFHNDEPEPKTTLIYTDKNYLDLYHAYLQRKAEYEKMYALKLTGEAKDKATKEVDDFFDNTVTSSFNRLEKFTSLLLEELQSGKKIKITVRGFTSPLAKSGYNIHLSKRRIDSFINYLKTYQGGIINGYFKNKMLTVIEDPAGESYVKTGVSDNLNDKRNSVYSPAASAERKIQVIDVAIENY